MTVCLGPMWLEVYAKVQRSTMEAHSRPGGPFDPCNPRNTFFLLPRQKSIALFASAAPVSEPNRIPRRVSDRDSAGARGNAVSGCFACLQSSAWVVQAIDRCHRGTITIETNWRTVISILCRSVKQLSEPRSLPLASQSAARGNWAKRAPDAITIPLLLTRCTY